MLYVEKENGIGNELHVGVTVPLSLKEDIRSVYLVQADGHELDFIFQQFHGLPFAQGRVVRWYGDHARFIVANINLKAE